MNEADRVGSRAITHSPSHKHTHTEQNAYPLETEKRPNTHTHTLWADRAHFINGAKSANTCVRVHSTQMTALQTVVRCSNEFRGKTENDVDKIQANTLAESHFTRSALIHIGAEPAETICIHNITLTTRHSESYQNYELPHFTSSWRR